MADNKRWEVVEQTGYVVQVVPEAGSDEVMHQLDEDCVCGPTVEPIPREDGSMGWVVTHHSLDGREVCA